MSVMAETSQSVMGPYVAMATVEFASKAWTAVFSSALSVNVVGGGGGEGDGGGGEGEGEGGGGGGDGDGGEGGGGDKGGDSLQMVPSSAIFVASCSKRFAASSFQCVSSMCDLRQLSAFAVSGVKLLPQRMPSSDPHQLAHHSESHE